MSKRIVVPLDPSEYTRSAIEIAVRRAKVYEATLVGVAVLDIDAIEDTVGGAPAGAIYYAEKEREKKIQEAQKVIAEIKENFIKRCEKEEIKYEVLEKTGEAPKEIMEEAKEADLIVVGIRTHFNLAKPNKPGETIKELLHNAVTPVLAVTDKSILPERVIVAYDGSEQSAKAMKAYAYISSKLPFANSITLLNVDEDIEKGQKILKKAKLYLEAHNFSVKTVVRAGKPSKVIYELAKELYPSLVVMGAYGRSGLSELFFGSTAREILEDGSLPLFVYH